MKVWAAFWKKRAKTFPMIAIVRGRIVVRGRMGPTYH